MAIKKLIFCVLFFIQAMNATEETFNKNEDFNEEKSYNAKVDENILTNKNSWNTRKWGSIYFLFPQLAFARVLGCFYSIFGELYKDFGIFLNLFLSGVVEYKYMFHKSFGINARLNLHNIELFAERKKMMSFVSFEPSIEWIYGRKGKNIFSGSFSLLGFGFMQDRDGDLVDDFCKKCWTLGFFLLKYEYDRRFYLNFGKVKTAWYDLKYICKEVFWEVIFANLLSIEFGLNIVGVNDGRKKKENINAKL